MTRLERECRSYAQYLTGRQPDEYVIRKYIECHEIGRIPPSDDAFDGWLAAVAARGPFPARVADAYASRFLKYGSLRKKLVLTLALLECSPGSFELLDRVDPGGVPGTLARLAWRVLVFGGALALSLVLFLPVRAWLGLFDRAGSRKARVKEA
jgi:hypothetical protein